MNFSNIVTHYLTRKVKNLTKFAGMSWLPIFLNALTENEFDAAKKMRLIGKEKQVFQYLLSFRKKELPSKQKIYAALDISETHYYKINSVLLSKLYVLFAPGNDIFSLLLFLRNKGLFNLFKHELLGQEKQLQKKPSGPENNSFYLKSFHLLIDLPYKYYDEKLTGIFGKRYLETLDKCTESDVLYVKYHKLFSDLNRGAAKKNPGKTLNTGLNDLLREEAKLSGKAHYLALYYLYRAIISYFTFYEVNTEKRLTYVKKAIALKDKIAYFFPIDIGKFLDLLYADSLMFGNKTEEAYKIYSRAFDSGIQNDMYGYYYHCEQYALIAIIMKQYEKAESFLNSVFETCIHDKIDIYATRGALTFAKLFLSSNNHKKAIHYIHLAKQINEKSFYLPFDLQLRVLENIYFYTKNDLEFARQLANRNLKFIQSRESGHLFESYVSFWKILNLFVSAREKSMSVDSETMEQYGKLQHNFKNLYCNLLEMLIPRGA
jgi:hypothetical protein